MIKRLVPPKNWENCPDTPQAETNAGRIAIMARKKEPGKVILVKILSINSEVCFQVLYPE